MPALAKRKLCWGLLNDGRLYLKDFIFAKDYLLHLLGRLGKIQLCCKYSYNYVDQVESVQKPVLEFALRGLAWKEAVPFPPYENRLKHIHRGCASRLLQHHCLVSVIRHFY